MSDELKRPDSGKRPSLGRGLSALFGEVNDEYSSGDRVRQTKQLPVEFIHPGRFQPRRKFDEEAIAELAQSVREKGILQPLLVRRSPDKANHYEIIAGERRWRAAQAAGLHEVPVVLRDLSDREALEISIIENVQRQDLTALEEAEGYRRLLDEFKHTQEDLARALGKSRSHVANTLRLMALPEPIKLMLHDGQLTAGHARALLTATNPLSLAEEVVAKGLNVRQTEQLARNDLARNDLAGSGVVGGGVVGGGVVGSGVVGGGNAPQHPSTRLPDTRPPEAKDADLLALEESLSAQLGLRVTISNRNNGGNLSIQYRTLDQLDDVLRRLTAD